MPHYTYSRGARRKKLFTRTSSTFTIKQPLSRNPHSTKKTKLHSKSTYFYRWGSSSKLSSKLSYVVPSVCGLALLVGGVVAINPQPGLVYAEGGNNSSNSNTPGNTSGTSISADNTMDSTTDNDIIPLATDPTISLTFNNDANFTAPATVGEVAYITNTFTVNVNKYANYTIKLNAMNGSGTELHGKDNYGATISGVGTNKTPTEFTDNTWGYGYSEDTNVNPSTLTYNSMPAYGSEEAMVTKTLTGTEEDLSQNYLLSFAAKLGPDSPSDHYIGNFILSVVGLPFTPETYTLTYNASNGTGGPTTQSCTQTSYNSPCDIVITNEVPTRTGYTFLGWADSNTATTAQYPANSTISINANKTVYAVWAKDTVYTLNYNANSGTGAPSAETYSEPSTSSATSHEFTISNDKPTRAGYDFLGWANTSNATTAAYQAGGKITVSKSTPSKTIYAVWKESFNGITTMQAMTSSICKDAPEYATKQLSDTRDSHTYWVTKFKDGNCWMTQNLDYNGGGTRITDLTNWSGDKQVDTSTAAYYDAGTYYYNGPNNTHSQGTRCTTSTNLGTCNQFSTSSADTHYHVGNYYSWTAVTNSICPGNWTVPTGNNTNKGSFTYLLTQYGVQNKLTNAVDGKSIAIYGDPFYFVYGGYPGSSHLSNAGSNGYYWSSTPNSSGTSHAYRFSFASSVNPSDNSYRSNGGSVRCVFIPE